MKIVCIGSGPASLYFALLMKLQDPSHDITVVGCNRLYDTFGWGVVFSDQMLGNLQRADAKNAAQILDASNHWDYIEIHIRGQVVRSGGYGFCGIGHKHLLNVLQTRYEEEGVKLVFETDVQDDTVYADADLIIASDGLNSRIRAKYAATYQPDIDTRRCRFVWPGAHKLFEALMFAFKETEHDWFQAHVYRSGDETSTFIVEVPEEVWRAAELETMEREDVIVYCEHLLAKYLDGNKLISNATRLRGSVQRVRSPRVVCRHWVHTNTHGTPVVLMGNVVHTAHFSIGSGTKLAPEDSIGLARSIDQHPDGLRVALEHYEAVHSVEVLHIQNAAHNSTEWPENVARYANLPTEQFTYSLLTRSQHISHENLRQRDKRCLEQFEDWVAEQAGAQRGPQHGLVPPMFTPFTVRGVTLKNRVVVSPMAQYSCEDGQPVGYHLVYLGAHTMSGAGLMMAEMVCVSPDARIIPGYPSLWNTDQRDGWAHIVQFVHANSDVRLGIQSGHAGVKGSTCVAWEGIDLPLEDGQNWPLISASPQQYLDGVSQWSRAMTRDDMDRVRDDFVHSAQLTAEAGFDWLELHCTHGYLLSSFISPLANQRNDEYGDSLKSRLRFPLEVFRTVREVQPSNKPMSVRTSTHDWVEGGIMPDDTVEIACVFKAAGADMTDCSSGQVSKKEQPVYGRMSQTPFTDRVRNEAGVATIAVGVISEADYVNNIIAAHRADPCVMTRPHLANPAWTLNETARAGYLDIPWPKQYRVGKLQLERNLERERAMAAQTAGLSPLGQANRMQGV